MKITQLAITGAYDIENHQHPDSRGTFLEWYRAPLLQEATGKAFELRQANMSVSAAGVVRGIHFADVPPGQAKYITCPKGAIMDYVVDIRLGSPTFGKWASVLLDDQKRNALYLREGLGHAFISLEEDTVVMYLCSTEYAPEHEHSISPLDPSLALKWPPTGRSGQSLSIIMSEKDRFALTLDKAKALNILPHLK